MNIFRTDQIRLLDAKTIELEGIHSSALMDRAAEALFAGIRNLIDQSSESVLVLAGPGNNGGDALAVARLLIQNGYQVTTVVCSYGKKLSEDATLQLERLQHLQNSRLLFPKTAEELTSLPPFDHLLDGLFGSGLNRPLEGAFAATVQWMNRQSAQIISIDLPSGLFGEDNRTNHPETIVMANQTVGLQFPRLAFFLAENEAYLGNWKLVDIGIRKDAIKSLDTPFSLTSLQEARLILKDRARFSHKGTFGKSLLITGSKGMTGAAILAGRGALRSGTGLLTFRIPADSLPIIQTAVPEATAQTWDNAFWDHTCSVHGWSAIGVGPGLGRPVAGPMALECLLKQQPQRLVIDADALNLLSENPSLLALIPAGTILTPHPGEFDRLAATSFKTGYSRLEAAIRFATAHQVHLILKGAYSACICPDGTCRFNSTGNPGMSTGGSGDVLTGIVVSLLAQGYSQQEACVLGTFLHGLSADLAMGHQSQESLLAGDIADNLGAAFNALRQA